MKTLKNISLLFGVLIAAILIYFTGAYVTWTWTNSYAEIPQITYMQHISEFDVFVMIANFSVGIICWVLCVFLIFQLFGLYFWITTPKSNPDKKKHNIMMHGDFRKYYDSTQKRNYWVLGYFGGGSINIIDAYEAAKQFSESVGVPIDSIQIDEIFKSRRFKGFKYLYSKVENQEPDEYSDVMKDVWSWLGD